MHYTIKKDGTTKAVERRSAKSALRQAHEFIRNGATSVTITYHDGKTITLAELAKRVEDDY